jgi:ribosomal protein L7/L12
MWYDNGIVNKTFLRGCGMEVNTAALLNAYDTMLSGNLFEKVAKELAVRSPETFIEIVTWERYLAQMREGKDFPTVDVLLCQKDMLIPAIKEHRTLTGAGLKESKDYCEARRAELRQLGKAVTP